ERITTKHAPMVVSALRSFLRHLLYRGAIDTDLAACVPTIATWSLSTVPKFLPAEQIQHVLDCCDRDTAIGKRDYAILLLLARLGLRAGEVVALRLEDVDWEAGLITVRGKGKRVTDALVCRSRRSDGRLSAPIQIGLFQSPCVYPGQSAVGRFRQLHRNLLAG